MVKIRDRGCYRHVSKRAFHQKWKDLGYEIVEDEDEKEDNNEDNNEDNLADKTVKELRKMAKELDLTGYYSLNKSDLIDAINQAK